MKIFKGKGAEYLTREFSESTKKYRGCTFEFVATAQGGREQTEEKSESRKMVVRKRGKGKIEKVMTRQQPKTMSGVVVSQKATEKSDGSLPKSLSICRWGKEYQFTVDAKLSINSWGQEIAELTGKDISHVLGRKYYHVVPRIFWGEKDALSAALERKKGFTLKGYNLGCFINHSSCDIRINFIKAPEHINGLRIAFTHISPCPVSLSLENSQRFINIGKTASSLAHGVRNPLNAIKGAVVYLSERYAREPGFVEFVKIMQDEILRLDGFIAKFLSSSLLNEGVSSTDINALLKKVEKLTALQTQACNINSLFKYGDIPHISVSPFHIEQVVLNVINNAVEAMRSGGQLSVTTRSEILSRGNFAVIEISDTGSGISEMKNAHMSVPTKADGKGFGLFIVREILQYYGGHLEIINRKNKGTTVKLYFPADNGTIGEL